MFRRGIQPSLTGDHHDYQVILGWSDCIAMDCDESSKGVIVLKLAT